VNEGLECSVRFTHEPSAAARGRMLSRCGEPLFIAGWKNVLMLHFEVDAEALQRHVPYELDLWDGKAFVSLVAFAMRAMRPRVGGRATALLFRPIATHDFLNVRTYVRHGEERGIHFIAEWLTSRLAVMLGPRTFGLPYHYGRIAYQHDLINGLVAGRIVDAKTSAALAYNARLAEPKIFQPCVEGSLEEWLMECYTAFNSAGGSRRFFRVWHPPWPQRAAEVTFEDQSLLTKHWPWFAQARFVGANFSPGFDTVWMGRPFLVRDGK
jgi:uncharacterized protein YqjF (DUF2071 family)